MEELLPYLLLLCFVALAVLASLGPPMGLVAPGLWAFFAPLCIIGRKSRSSWRGSAHGLGTAVVLSAETQPGRWRVRWQGQSWAALNSDPTIPLALNEEVVVVERQGTCLQVISKRSLLANN